MRRIHTLARLAAAALLALLAWSGAAGAADDKKTKTIDLFWTHPDMAGVGLRSVAMLPAVTYSNDLKAEKEIEIAWGPHARTSGSRWYFSTMAKDLLRRAFGGDSILTIVRTQILEDARVDSLTAQRLCQSLRTSAVLSLRADIWEQVEMEWNQSGKPWTRVQLKAALVDSSGRLLWTASGSETGEGPMHQAESGTLGVKGSGLGLQAVTGQSGAPSYQEVLALIFTRWIENFPGRAAPAPDAGDGP